MSITSIRGVENPHNVYKMDRLLDITTYPFYHGPLDGIKCEELLRGQPNGTYLVRDGEKPGQFYLSWVTDSDQCHFAHVPFCLTQEGWMHKNMHINAALDLKVLVPKMTLLVNEQCVQFNRI